MKPRMLEICVPVVALLAGALGAEVTGAAPGGVARSNSPWGANERVNDADTAYRNMASVAVDPQGNAYAVWRDEREGNADIYFRRRSAGGSWSESVKINSDAGTADQYSPSIAVDPNGNAYAVWQDYRNGNWDIYFSYRPAGGSWGANTLVNSDTETASQYCPSIAVDAIGNAYVVWQDHRNGDFDVYFRYRSASGSWGDDARVNDDAGSAVQGAPSIAVDPTGNAHAVWADQRAGNSDVYFSYRPTGGSWGSNVRVNDDAGTADQGCPSIAVDPSGNAYTVWMDGRNGDGDAYFRYRSVGGTWGTSVRVSDQVGSGSLWTFPDIAVDLGGNAYAVWDDTRGESVAVYSSYRPSDGSWAKNVRVPDPDQRGAAAQVAVDSSGRSYAVFTRCLDMYNCNIYFSRNPALHLPFDADNPDESEVGEDCRGTDNGLGQCQSAYLDHHYPTYAVNADGVFRPFWSDTITEKVGVYDCSPATHCYDGHEGHDYRLVAGTPVRAAAAGTAHCEYAGSPGYGYTVLVDHHNGYSTRYAHLDSCGGLFAGGDVSVSVGQEIGRVGSSGTEHPHLHFGVYHNGQVVDPWGWNRRQGEDPWEQSDPTTRRSACLWVFGCAWEAYLTVSTGGGTSTPDGSIAASAPPGAVAEATALRLTLTPDPVSQASGVPAHYSFDLSAQDIHGNPVDTFLEPLTIVVNYAESILDYVVESSLAVYYWDVGTSTWQGLATALDVDNNTATASTDHLSLFALLGEPKNPAPTIVGVTPINGCNALHTNITVDGKGFLPTSSVRLGDSALAVTFIGPGAVTSVVPPGFEPGTYDLRVVNPDAQDALLESAFVVDECSLLYVPLALKSY